MKYIEIAIETTTNASELIADLLSEYSEMGVSIYDSNDITYLINTDKASWDYIEEDLLKENIVVVKGYIELENSSKIVEEVNKRLSFYKENAFCDFGSLKITLNEVDGDTWREKWKENFKPIPISKVVICPDWMDYENTENKVVVKIDSNMAFGTGEHETTSMCIELLQKYLTKNSVVLDVGCGSGILGITASLLGAKEVVMTDIDENAVIHTKHNVELNKAKNCQVKLKNLLDDTTIKGDLLLANIMADVLIGFSKDISKNMLNGAIAILSGILRSKKQEVITAYKNAGFKVINELEKGEWCAIVVQK